MNKIKTIFFDIDGTLYPIKGLNRQFVKLYVSHPIKAFLFFKARKRVRAFLLETNDASTNREVFLSRQAATVGKDKSYFDGVYSVLVKNRRIVPYEGLKELLIDLRSRGYILGTLSDFPVENKLKELGLDEFFQYKLSSEDCGYLKPDKRAFDYIERGTGISKTEILYIGDSITKDYNGSKNTGMSAVLVDGSSDKGFPFKDVYSVLDIPSVSTDDL